MLRVEMTRLKCKKTKEGEIVTYKIHLFHLIRSSCSSSIPDQRISSGFFFAIFMFSTQKHMLCDHEDQMVEFKVGVMSSISTSTSNINC